jgi:hypothetical protein
MVCKSDGRAHITTVWKENSRVDKLMEDIVHNLEFYKPGQHYVFSEDNRWMNWGQGEVQRPHLV